MNIPEYLWIPLAIGLPVLTGIALLAADLTARHRRPDDSNAPARRWSVLGSALAIATAALTLAASIGAAITQVSLDLSWIPAIGVRFHLGVDSLSAALVVTAATAGLVAVAVSSAREDTDTPSAHPAPEPPAARSGRGAVRQHGWILLAIGAGLIALMARDAVVLVIALQSTLLALWALTHGTSRADDAVNPATRFILVTTAGSALIFGGVIARATQTGTTDLTAWATAGDTAGTQWPLALVLLIGLGTMVPLWPLHTWAPALHSRASTGGSVLIVGVLATVAVHALLRLVVAALPHGLSTLAPILGGLAVVGVIWAGLIALIERDLARVVAWVSIAHLGLILLALSTGTATGLQIALLGTVAHAAILTLLVTVTGELTRQWGSSDLATARAALREVAPRLGFVFILAVAAAIGLPGLAGFWTEFGAIVSSWSPAADRAEGWFRLFAVLAALGAVLLVCVGVRVLREVWSGDRNRPALTDLGRRGLSSTAVLVLLAILVVAIGVYPIPLLDLTSDAVDILLGGRP